jgi:2-phosphosulfolactate phosphatase
MMQKVGIMRKINVITQKELVDSDLIRKCTAVVIDVFLATSTIANLIENNYNPVYAVEDMGKALSLGAQLNKPYLLLGEWNGKKLNGFQYPDPSCIRKPEKNEAVIICSTNGTIAIEKSKGATRVYTSSLVNGQKVAEHIHSQNDKSSIILICSGNAGRFSMEDFVGAGQLVDHLVQKGEYSLSDSARMARDNFRLSKSTGFANLYKSETAFLLEDTGYSMSSKWVIEHFEQLQAVPILKGDKLVKDKNR